MGFKYIFTSLKKGSTPSDSELLKIPSFMFCRFLGGHPVTIKAANEFNKYYKEIPVDIQYKLIKNVFSKKGIFPKMLKQQPKEDHLDSLCKYYKISREKAKEYREFLSDEEFDRIEKIYEIKG
jgi:hypothetical protein